MRRGSDSRPTSRSTNRSAVLSALRRRRDSGCHLGAQLRDLEHSDVRHRTGDQVVEAGEVVGGRRQRQARAPGDSAVPDRLETAFAQQFGGRADQRVPPALTLRGDGSLGDHHRLRRDWHRRGDDGRRRRLPRERRPPREPRLQSPRTWCQPGWCRIGLSDKPSSAVRRTGTAGRHFMMARMPEMSRRAVLRLGTGAAAGALGAYAVETVAARPAPGGDAGHDDRHRDSAGATPRRSTRRRPPRWSPVRSCRRHAVASPPTGRSPDPPGQSKPLRPVIALHGKGSSAATVMEGGVEQGLAQAVAAGLPPFAVVAVDGGGSYWHKRASGEDCGAMVLNELIPMLGGQGLDTSRVGFLGWSMGGYGALLLGGRLGPGRTAAICAVSPALWMSSGAAAPGAFDGAGRLRGQLGLRDARAGVDPDPGGLRQQRSVLRRDQAVHRAAAHSAGGRVLPGRATTGRSGARNCPPN